LVNAPTLGLDSPALWGTKTEADLRQEAMNTPERLTQGVRKVLDLPSTQFIEPYIEKPIEGLLGKLPGMETPLQFGGNAIDPVTGLELPSDMAEPTGKRQVYSASI